MKNLTLAFAFIGFAMTTLANPIPRSNDVAELSVDENTAVPEVPAVAGNNVEDAAEQSVDESTLPKLENAEDSEIDDSKEGPEKNEEEEPEDEDDETPSKAADEEEPSVDLNEAPVEGSNDEEENPVENGNTENSEADETPKKAKEKVCIVKAPTTPEEGPVDVVPANEEETQGVEDDAPTNAVGNESGDEETPLVKPNYKLDKRDWLPSYYGKWNCCKFDCMRENNLFWRSRCFSAKVCANKDGRNARSCCRNNC